MNELTVFTNEQFGSIRTIEINNEPWFVGKDIADVLGYAKPENAISNHVDGEDKTTTLIQGTGSNYKSKAVLINESGLYSLILSSKLPNAKEFKRWVTAEVLPTIRKHGMYATEDLLNNPDLAIKTFQALKEEQEKNKRLVAENAEMKPKALFADAVATSHSSILVGDLAKILRQNGVIIGQHRLFNWLRNTGYLIKSGASKNMPTQRAMEMGLFEVKESTVTNPDGTVRITRTTKVTGKGQQYFINKFLGNYEEKEETAEKGN